MKFRNLAALLTLILFSVAVGCQDSTPPSVRDISQDELLESPPPGAVILDVRTDEEFARGHVPNAILIPHDQLANRLSELGSNTDAPIVVYCESGKRAGMAGETLLAAGYTNVLHLDGDMRGWREHDRPTAR
jgi:rhodanese-related sulfurtransferase